MSMSVSVSVPMAITMTMTISMTVIVRGIVAGVVAGELIVRVILKTEQRTYLVIGKSILVVLPNLVLSLVDSDCSVTLHELKDIMIKGVCNFG